MNKRNPTHGRSGFTLVEVLVVVAIIALLISILMPSLANARAQARLATCMSNLHQFGVAFGLYGQDNRQHAPPNAAAGTPELSFRDSDWWYYHHMLARYASPGKLSEKGAGLLGVFACPAEPETGRAYAMNGFEGLRDKEQNPDGAFNPYTVKLPARYLLLGEAHAIYLDPASGLWGARHVIGVGRLLSPYDKFRTVVETADRGPFSGYINFARHGERANFLLCDLSVRGLRTSQVVDDPNTRSRLVVWWMTGDRILNPPPP